MIKDSLLYKHRKLLFFIYVVVFYSLLVTSLALYSISMIGIAMVIMLWLFVLTLILYCIKIREDFVDESV